MEGAQFKTLIQEVIVHICTDAQKTIGSAFNLDNMKTEPFFLLEFPWTRPEEMV